MAYDPEARKQSNNALVIGGVALAIVIVGALAWSMTRPPAEPNQTVVTVPGRDRVVTNTVTVPVPVAGAPSTIVVPPPVVTGGTKTIERNNTTTIREKPVVVAPASKPATSGGGSTNTNVTVNVPPAESSKPAADAAPTAEAPAAGATTTDSTPAAPEPAATSSGY